MRIATRVTAQLALSLVLAANVPPLAAQVDNSASRRLSRVPAPTGPQGVTEELYTGSYALLVGVSRYDAAAAWAPLDSVPGEMTALADALRAAGFDRVEQLTNPTGAELRRGVEDFIGRHGYVRGHRLVFFFSGHGYTLDGGTRGYFVPRDAPDPLRDEPTFRRVALSMQQVATWAQDLVARHALFSFDSCFSGTIFRTRDRPVPQRISEMSAKPVRQFMSAGSAGEPVPARSVYNPIFIRGLKGAADLDGDGYVTGTELGNYVQREVIAYRTRQTPQFGKIRDPNLDEGDIVFAVPAAPAPAAAPPTTVTPVRVGGTIKPPTKLRHVEPEYPKIAVSARVQGVVILEATIDTNGRVTNATVLRSVPLLDQAAIDAVRQWEYSQTLLNGIPVPVIMTVTVSFTLQ